MYKIFVLAILLCTGIKGFSQKSFYDLEINSIRENVIKFSDYKNRTVLIVNTALNSTDSSQLGGLQKLYQEFKGRGLVIIAVPSNDFLNEPKSENEIRDLYKSDTGFIVTARSSVKGNNISDLYKWLSQKSENSAINQNVNRDFQKFLISKNGKLIGVFSGKLKPESEILKNAIKNN